MNWIIICSGNGLSPDRHQAITWTNAGIVLIGPLRTNFSEILLKIHIFSFEKMHLKTSSKQRPFCLSLNVLMQIPPMGHTITMNAWLTYQPAGFHSWRSTAHQIKQDRASTLPTMMASDFSLTIFCSKSMFICRIHIAVTQLLHIRLIQTFAHVTTAELSCNVQKFCGNNLLDFGWEQNEISIKFEFWSEKLTVKWATGNHFI